MRIRYTKTALVDLRAVFVYLSREADEHIAETVLARLRSIVSSLIDFPDQGRSGRVAGTRELIIPKTSLIAVYRVEKGEVQIISLIHIARRWPETF
jgi:addiction module RelE/StbE family toxin